MSENTALYRSIDPQLSHDFAKMSFICAIMIVYLHTGCAARGEVFFQLMHRAITSLCQVAIPWFFFASGFFLSRHIGEEGWWSREVIKRIRSLMVPFWIWGTLIFLVYCFIALCIRVVGYDYHGTDALSWISVRGVLRVAGFDYAASMPTMWYMRSLFLLVVMSPLIYAGRIVLVVLLGLLYLTFNICFTQIGSPWDYVFEFLVSLRGMLYFSFGMYFYPNRKLFARFLCGILGAIGVGLLILRLTVATEWRALDVLMVPGLMAVVYHCVKRMRIQTMFTNLSFSVYVMHMIIAYCISALYGVVGVGGEGRTLFVFGIVRFFVTLGSVILMTLLLKRQFPKLAKILFGGR